MGGVPDGQPKSDAKATRRLLCLSGGGYRGLFSVVVLEHIEARLQSRGVGRLRDHFDLVAGTSIGGLLAAGIAAGVATRRLRETLLEDGPAVFPSRAFATARQLAGPLYSADTLARVIRKALGAAADQLLNQIDVPLLIPAVSWISGALVSFASRGLAGAAAPATTLADACLSTSAAPTYFPPHLLDSDVLVDGGLVANAPDLCALLAAQARWALPAAGIEIVSIGTAGSPAGGVAGDVPRSGARWVRGAEIVKLVLAAQERLAVTQCEALLGAGYFRVDQQPSQGQLALQAMDRVDASTTVTLQKLAQDAIATGRRTAPAWASQLL
jgi:predicted acylesterase/phospholipase RssA